MRLLSIAFVLTTIFCQAQIAISSSQLAMGDVTIGTQSSMTTQLTNNSSESIAIDAVVIFNTDYTSTISDVVMGPSETSTIEVFFEPTQNLNRNSEAIILLSNGNEIRIDITGNGRYADTYYSATFNKSHQDLKDELKSIISANYVSLGYNGARDKMYAEIDNVNGVVTCVYTGKTANFTTRSGANSNSFNCEHTWPQSMFSSSEPAKSDIHHLFPTDVTANSKRSNYPFATVGSPSWSVGGSKQGGSFFEPRDVQKGASARALMYFTLRHSNASNFITSQESILKNWHDSYPPSASEIARNNAIFTYQKNRNPFVDHPEFMDRINNLGTNDPTPVVKKIVFAQDDIQYGSVTDADTRSIHFINDGNQSLSGFSNVTSSGKVIISQIASGAGSGDAGEVQIGFASGLTDGVYKDTLVFNFSSFSSQTIKIPVQFTIGESDVTELNTENFPKPFFNKVLETISFHGDEKELESVRIYNGRGQEVLFNDIKSSLTDIPFSGFSEGVYFVVIKSNGLLRTSKVLVH